MRVLIRAPDHLGDGVMALPAIARVASVIQARGGEVEVLAPRWGPVLYRHLPVRVLPREQVWERARGADLAVLLKPSFSAALRALPARRRVGLAGDGRSWLLSEALPVREEHRADSLVRVAEAALSLPAEGPALPAYPTSEADAAELPTDLPADAVLLLPGTASAETVAWRGFAQLGLSNVIAAGGPGDEPVLAAIGCRVLPTLSLPSLALLATRVRAVVGNDSGLPHLAAAARRAAGLSVADVHIVYASTDPARTGAPGSRAWPGSRPPCWPCYAKRCAIGAPCRDADPAPLRRALS